MRSRTSKTGKASNRAGLVAGFALAILLAQHAATGAQAPVNLGTAGNFAILAKTGISTTGTTAVTGDIGVSPAAASFITGFALVVPVVIDSAGNYSTSPQVTGKVYAADFNTPSNPTPANLTTAVSDMETAFTDAAGRTLPDFTELGAGNIGGMTLSPGLYKWGTDVSIPADVTLSGGPNDVWIFQIAGSFTMASAKSVILSGGAQARNVFWQVAGGVGVALGTTSHFEGIILTQKAITLETGASINGRLLAQTAVTLQANSVTTTSAWPPPPRFGPVSLSSDGTVTLSITNTPGLALTLQFSTNLTSLTTWTLLSTPTPAISPYKITVGTTSDKPRRFYRALYL